MQSIYTSPREPEKQQGPSFDYELPCGDIFKWFPLVIDPFSASKDLADQMKLIPNPRVVTVNVNSFMQTVFVQSYEALKQMVAVTWAIETDKAQQEAMEKVESPIQA